jgi:protease II
VHLLCLLLESSVPELGPTGEYAYYFDDDLIVGKRTYRRKKLNGKSTPALDDNSMMNNNKSNNSSNNEQTVFDMNLHFEFLGPMSISVDERFVVRMITYIDSGMKPKIVVTNIDSGINYIMRNGASQHQIHNVEFGPMYSKTHTSKADESYSLFLTTCDEIGRPSAVYACTFDGESFGQLELVVEDKDGANFVDVQRTKGCEYVAINSTSKTDNEVYLIGGEIVNRESSESSNGIPWQPILVKERKDGVQYFVDCGNKGEVIILAHEFPNLLNNDMGQKDHGGLGNEISVFEESIQSLPLASNYFGKSIHNHSDKSAFFVEDMDLFENYLVLYERSSIDSSQQIRILNRDSKGFDQHVVPLGELQGVEHQMITPGGNMHFYTNSLHFNIETPLEPPITCTYNCEKRSLTASSGSSHNSFHSKRFDIVSDDDVSIPLSLYFDKNVTTMGVLLIGYGSYGQNQNLAYDPALLPLVKRGFVIVSESYFQELSVSFYTSTLMIH